MTIVCSFKSERCILFRPLDRNIDASGERLSCEISGMATFRYIPLALLAPEIVQSICDGSQPASLTAEVLKHNAPLPLEWTKQCQILRCR